MGKKHEAESWLRQGLYPSQIASKMGVSVNTVIPYLQMRVGEGALRLSDIYLAFPAGKRAVLTQALAEAAERRYPDWRALEQNGLTREDFELFRDLQRRRVFAGDMYEYVCGIEMKLHRGIRRRLESEYGEGEDGWWRQGIPQRVRVECQRRREEDPDPCDSPYAYTTLIDLLTIIKAQGNWSLLKGELPEPYRANRRCLEGDLVRLNSIRNAIMHPVKNRGWSGEDFEFVRRLYERFVPAD